MTFLITGAGRGIGLEYTRQLLALKKNVIAWVRNPSKSTDLENLQNQYPSQLKIQDVDVTQEQSIIQAVAQIKSVDVLINNAGVLLDGEDSFEELSLRKIEDTFKVNVLAPIAVTQKLMPLLLKSPTPVVANMSSLMGSIKDNSGGAYYAYRMSKTALNMFTKSLSIDYPQVKTLCLHPGWVQTDMGGPNAQITMETSVKGLLHVILEPQKYDSGAFVNYRGIELPW
ncbi:MAG: SDR family oxidoreductase [Bdellovibrionales bacterium]|nr:SDR family oxidoreductase [Bdellovibrionales bacterium]